MNRKSQKAERDSVNEIIRNEYLSSNLNELAKRLGLSRKTLYNRAYDMRKKGDFDAVRSLGFGPGNLWGGSGRPREWTDERKDIIRKEYPDTYTPDLAAKLGITPKALTEAARKIGVKKAVGYMASIRREQAARNNSGLKRRHAKPHQSEKPHPVLTPKPPKAVKPKAEKPKVVKLPKPKEVKAAPVPKPKPMPLPPPIRNSRQAKRPKGAVMVAGTFVKPDKSMTFEKATAGKVSIQVQINGKPVAVWCLPGKEEATRKKWAAHVVQPPFSQQRAGGNIRR